MRSLNMDKKDIYEHLAKIYLDASEKKKPKTKKDFRFLRSLAIGGIAVIFGFAIFSFTHLTTNKPLNSQIALLLCNDAVKINFNFNPAKKESYTLNIGTIDLTRFKTLGFSVKKANFQDNISLRVEFVSKYKEKAELYFKYIPHRWQDYTIKLADFKGISDWAEISSLSFIVEEWNVKQKQGIIYIDNVRLIK